MRQKLIPIRIGDRFGILTVIGRTPEGSRKAHRRWICRCDCGNESHRWTSWLRRSLSCGCLPPRSGKHYGTKQNGLSYTAAYRSWANMIERCCNPLSVSYANYGGRGITVCDEWRQSFQAFYRDMGDRTIGLSLDRIDVDGPYGPDNCRWATQSDQLRNSRRTLWVEWRGERRRLIDLADEFAFPASVARSRLRLGWSIERVFAEPIAHRARLRE